MDKTSLVADDIAEGRRFVEALRRGGLPVAVAMWLRKVSSDHWSLGIASPDVQAHGPLSVLRFGEAIRRSGFDPSLSVGDVTYFNTSAEFMHDIARFPTRLESDSVTVDSFSLNGTEIEKAVVFWIDRTARPSRQPPTPTSKLRRSA